MVLRIVEMDVILFLVYRPPDSTEEEFGESLSCTKEALEQAKTDSPKCTTLVGLGDFNFPFIK